MIAVHRHVVDAATLQLVPASLAYDGKAFESRITLYVYDEKSVKSEEGRETATLTTLFMV